MGRGRGQVSQSELEKAMVMRYVLPTPSTSSKTPGPESGERKASENEGQTEGKTRRATLLEQYGVHFLLILCMYMQKAADPRIGTACDCGVGERTTRCRDCFQLRPLCKGCFLQAHKHNPFHWAEFWGPEDTFFTRYDLSRLDETWAVHLGHGGDPCPLAAHQSLLLTVVDTNGVHGTKVKFCGCAGPPRKWEQLFEANLFPGSFTDPGTAFTLRALREFQVLCECSKATAYDYCKALAGLTNHSYPQEIPEFYAKFLLVSRIWSYLRANKWLGQGHGIDVYFPRRPVGNMVVYCPTCPEEGVNLEPGWAGVPVELRHLHACRRTLDGNFQANHYSKNHDPTDISLYQGRSVFPSAARENAYLAEVPQLQKAGNQGVTTAGAEMDRVTGPRRGPEEKANCGFIKAMEKQNRLKFKGMDITGVINVQCDHIFVHSTVDMQRGERFANSDLALAKALELRMFDKGSVPDQPLSYDSNCTYSAHVVERMKRWFPHLAHQTNSFRFTIPAAHVRNHLDMCMYLFSSSYKDSIGHFPGETAELVWPELNLLGPSIRQMSHGQRQDAIIQVFLSWNTRKVMGMSLQLQKELETAKKRYFQTRNNLQALYDIHKDRIEEWNAMDRSPRFDRKHKRVVHSVYATEHSESSTLRREVQRLMKSNLPCVLGTGMSATQSAVVRFLREGVEIEDAQAALRRKVRSLQGHGRAADRDAEEQVIEMRERMSRRIDRWRERQRVIMPDVGDRVLALTVTDVEEERLFLPSDLPLMERAASGMEEVSEREVLLRKAGAWSLILALQATVRLLSAIFDNKNVHNRGQEQNTRSTEEIKWFERVRLQQLEDYNRHRSALVALGAIEEKSTACPKLTVEDTYRKPTHVKRALGDSLRADGSLWRMRPGFQGRSGGGITMAQSEKRRRGQGVGGREAIGHFGTQMSRRTAPARGNSDHDDDNSEGRRPLKKRKIEGAHVEGSKMSGAILDGFIWKVTANNVESEEWAREQDRVKFFRDEAEFERWRETLEIKHAEFHRCIKTFQKMAQVWGDISKQTTWKPSTGAGHHVQELAGTQWTKDVQEGSLRMSPGQVAYALQQQQLFMTLEKQCQGRFEASGIESLRVIPEGKCLADVVLEFRNKEQEGFPKLHSERPAFVDPTLSGNSLSDPGSEDENGSSSEESTGEERSDVE